MVEMNYIDLKFKLLMTVTKPTWKGIKVVSKASKNHVDNMFEIKLWYIIIDNIIK
jgi:hypothetical protein